MLYIYALFQNINMRKYLFATIIAMVALSHTQAQTTGCGFKVPPRSFLKSSFQSVYEARDILKTMLDTIKWQENFNIKEQNGIRNAYATIINKVRYIIYDNAFLEDIDSYASTKWASISVLAHEMGHHYYNHVVSSTGSTPPKEIEADAFSGYIMAKLGASLDESVAAMKAIASDRASSSHPGKADRITAITKGWNLAKTSTTKPTTPTNPTNPPVPTNPTTPTNPTNPTNPSNPGNTSSDPSTDPSWIALSIQSTKEETVYLSDDGKNFQAAPIPAGQPFVFKFEIYNYGWLRLKYYNGYRTFKLFHGKDYMILYNRRTKNWTVTEVPE